MSDIKIKIADIVNEFIQDNRLVNADLCNDEEEFKGLHSGLTIGGANEIVDQLEALIQEQVRLARIDEVERFLVEPGEVIPYNNNTFADGFRYVVEKLQARLEELRGEK